MVPDPASLFDLLLNHYLSRARRVCRWVLPTNPASGGGGGENDGGGGGGGGDGSGGSGRCHKRNVPKFAKNWLIIKKYVQVKCAKILLRPSDVSIHLTPAQEEVESWIRAGPGPGGPGVTTTRTAYYQCSSTSGRGPSWSQSSCSGAALLSNPTRQPSCRSQLFGNHKSDFFCKMFYFCQKKKIDKN